MHAWADRATACRGNAGTARRCRRGTVHAGSWVDEWPQPGPALAPKEPRQRQVCDRPGSPAERPQATHSGRSPAAWRTPQLQLSDRQEVGRLWPWSTVWRQCGVIVASLFGAACHLLELRQAQALRAAPPACGQRHAVPAGRWCPPPAGASQRPARPAGSPAHQDRWEARESHLKPVLMARKGVASTRQARAREGPPGLPGSLPLAVQMDEATAPWASLGAPPPAPGWVDRTPIAGALLVLQASGIACALNSETAR